MAEFPKVFLSGPADVESVFSLLAPKLAARGVRGARMPFPAQPLDPARVSLRELAECQAMALFLRGKYGTPWAELSGKSITEHEFLEAVKRQLPLFCFMDTSSAREPALQEFVDTIRRTTQKTLIYEERDFSDPIAAADRIASVIADFRWVPSAFASFGEWENLLLAQYSRVTGAHVERNSYPPAIGRTTERAKLLQWIKDPTPEKNTAIITGMPGFGKTLFTYHAARGFLESTVMTHSDVLIIVPGVEFDLQSLREIAPDPKSSAPIFLVIDDADERGDIATLLTKLASSPHLGRIKVLLTCQEGSTEVLYFKGYPFLSKSNSTEIHLPRLELEELRAFRTHRKFNVTDSALVALLKITNGIPLYVDLYLNRGYQLGTISTHAEMEEHFLRQRLGDIADDREQLGLLKCVALVGSLSLQHPFFKQLLQELGLPEDVSVASGILVKKGLIYKVGTRHRVTDRLIQDFVLAKYWTVNPDCDRLLSILATASELAAGILENLARAEWVRAKTGATDLPFQDIWSSIEVAFGKSADSAERTRIINLLKNAAYFLPGLTLKLAVATRQRQLELLKKSECLPPRELEAASDISYSLGHWPDHFEAAIDILWDLGKRDTRSLNAHPSHAHRHLESLAKLKPGAPLARYKTLIDHIELWLGEGKQEPRAWSNSPLEVFDALLEWEWSQEHYYKGAFTIQRGEIPYSDVLEELRIRAVTILGECILGSYGPASIGEALHKMRGQLPIYQHPGWDKVGEATLMQLRRARDHYFAQNRPTIPYVIYQQIDSLLELFEKSEKKKIDPGCRALRTEIQGVLKERFSKEFALLEVTVSFRYSNTGADDIKRAQETLISLGPAAARALLDNLQQELGLVGIEPKTAPIGLSGATVDAWREFSLQLYENLISQSRDPRLVGHAIALLWDCRLEAEQDTEARKHYITLLNIFPELKPPIDRPELAGHLKGYVRWFIQILLSKQIRLLPEEISLVKGWRDSPDISWRLIVEHLAQQNPHLARELILEAAPGKDRKAADEVCSALINSKTVLPLFLEDDWRSFLRKLEEVPSLDDYWIEQTLIYASNQHPRPVARFFLRRLELRNARNGPGEIPGRYDALPFGIEGHLANAFSGVGSDVRRELIEEALALIIAAEPGDRYFLNSYANLVAGRFTREGVDILLLKAKSSDANQLEAIAGVVKESYPNFAFDHPEVIETLLESAVAVSPDILSSVRSYLYLGAGVRGYSRAIGQPSAVHVQLRTASQSLKRRFLPGTPTYEFYSSLEKSADADIKREELEDEETLDQ